MSATESKVKTAPKTSKKTLKSAEAEALKVALDAAQVEYVPVTALVKSPLNVRTIPYPAEKVCSMADSIEAIGLLQNLVVHNLPDGRCGVAAGGRRLKALQLLQSENRIDAGYQVMVKKVPDELAVAASMAENEQQMAMHPSEQIAGFRTLAEQGKTPAQIGDLLGFGTRHVQRMLKLTELAPEILAALAKDEITTEHCQALALESDQKRQVEVLESARKRSRIMKHQFPRSVTSLSQKRFPQTATNSALWERPHSVRMKSGLISSAAKTAAMSKVHRSIPPCWKNCRTSRSTSAKRKAGHGVMVVLTRFHTTGRTLKSGACMLSRLWNIPKPNQNVLQSWKLWKLSMKTRTPA